MPGGNSIGCHRNLKRGRVSVSHCVFHNCRGSGHHTQDEQCPNQTVTGADKIPNGNLSQVIGSHRPLEEKDITEGVSGVFFQPRKQDQIGSDE